MTLTEFITGIRDRLERSTPGPWYLVDSLTDEESGVPGGTIAKVVAHQMLDDEEHCKTFIICEPDTCKDSDAALIASSPTDLALAVEVIEIMRETLEKYATHEGSGHMTHYWAESQLAKIDALLKGSGE